MKFELFIARRIRLAKEKSRGIFSSTTIAVAGITLAIIVMMLTIAIVLGFKHEIRNKVMGFDSQIKVSANAGYGDGNEGNEIEYSKTIGQIIDSITPGCNKSLTISLSGILKTTDNFMGIVFNGMDSNYDWEFVKSNIIEGCIPDYTDGKNNNKVILSHTITKNLGLGIGDKVHAYFFENNNIRTRSLEIAAIYESHFGDYDKLTAFCDISLPQKLKGSAPKIGDAIRITGLPDDKINDKATELQDALIEACNDNRLKYLYRVDSVYDTGVYYFNWLDLLDTNVAVILILMTFVAGFTLISCLFIIILERVNMIGILKATGATNRQIRKIFIYVAERLVIRGIIIGNAIALTLIILQDKKQILPLDPDAYYLSYVPVELNWWYISLLNIGVIVISCMMLILPSHIISTIAPSRIMRYE